MAWSKDKVLPTNINNGSEFTSDSVLTVAELNAIVNNSFYGVDFAEAMADAPDVSEVGSVGTPSVTLIENIKNGKTYKKFKFSNLRGHIGETGARGFALFQTTIALSPVGYDSLITEDSINLPNDYDIMVGDFVISSKNSMLGVVIGNASPSVTVRSVANLKGDMVSLEQTTGQSETNGMSQKAITDAINNATGDIGSILDSINGEVV